jgi:hypothetical protein
MQVAILGQKATSEGKDRQGGNEGKEGGKRERGRSRPSKSALTMAGWRAGSMPLDSSICLIT